MLKNLIKISFIIPIIAFFVQACDDPNDPNRFNFSFPEDEPIYYTEHIAPFLLLRCSYTGCHASNSQAGGIDLSTYFEVMSSPGVVNTSTPESSLLLQVMDLRNPHLLNLNLVPPTENQIEGIRRWIEEGAEI